MKSDDLIDLIGDADDEHIRDAKTARKKRMPRWVKWSSALAACLVLAIGVGGFFLLPRMGGSAGAGGSGHEEGSAFMSYAGPVFPLTLREENAAISARRDITLDFAPWVPVWISNEEEAASRTDLTEEERQEVLDNYNEWYPEGGRYRTSGDILVTDSYTLTNSGPREQTLRVLYPFASSLNDLTKKRPSLTLNGEEVETALHAGSYAGGFQGAWEHWSETQENPGSLNLARFESWEGYRDLLSDGTYLRRALGDFVDLRQIPVTVYAFTDPWGPEKDGDKGIPNPSIRVLFELDYENTQVLSYGFHSGLYDRENGIMGKGFSIPAPDERKYGEPYYLIVIGNDIRNITCQGYATGGWDTEKTVEAGVSVTRSESNLEEALRLAAGFYYPQALDVESNPEMEPDYGFELYFGLMKEHLMAYGLLSDQGMERYSHGMIEELDVLSVDRVFWLEAEVTLPAGESVTLNAVLKKEPSFDFYCANTKNEGISGYDLVTQLASNLTFTRQTARLEDREQIEIVRQNFGFDTANGIHEVELDQTQPHYYLEVSSIRKD